MTKDCLIGYRKEDFPNNLPLAKLVPCKECGHKVALTQTSIDIIKRKKNVDVLCTNCAKKILPANPPFRRPNKKQILEMRKAIPDFDETKIRRAMQKIKQEFKKVKL